jgi:hypothetical protein
LKGKFKYYLKQIQPAQDRIQNSYICEQHSITATKHATDVIILINRKWNEKGNAEKKNVHPLHGRQLGTNLFEVKF